jgi:hypothetical protein
MNYNIQIQNKQQQNIKGIIVCCENTFVTLVSFATIT